MATFTTRPVIMGTRGVVTAGHYLVASAGLRMLMNGGNAIDAAAAMGICETLLEPQSCGIGGEVPTLVYSAREGKTYAISGMGWSPKAFTLDWCRENGIDLIPGDGYLPATVPAPVDTWATAVAQFRHHELLRDSPANHRVRGARLPCLCVDEQPHRPERGQVQRPLSRQQGEIYLDNGKARNVGEIQRNPDFGAMLRIMCRAEDEAKGRGRVAGIEAARDAFYKGEIAEKIVRFMEDNPVEDASGEEHRGLLSYEDMAEWHADVEEPLSLEYNGLDVHKCSSWTQGPVFLQQLSILRELDVKGYGHNSPEYLHAWVESAKMAFADREAYYGDPKMDDVPFDLLLSGEYGNMRAGQIGEVASLELRPWRPRRRYSRVHVNRRSRRQPPRLGRRCEGDQGPRIRPRAHRRHDSPGRDGRRGQHGRLHSERRVAWLLPGGIKGLGFPMGTRGQMFYLNSERPNALEPRKRPRATLTPTIATKDGGPFMAFGTPGGDSQEQWTIQFFLNHVEFGMDLQEALDAPTVHTTHFPSSFYPRHSFPGRVVVESRMSDKTLDELRKRGHDIEMTGDWANGKVLGIRYHSDTGTIAGAASAKNNIGYAMGW